MPYKFWYGSYAMTANRNICTIYLNSLDIKMSVILFTLSIRKFWPVGCPVFRTSSNDGWRCLSFTSRKWLTPHPTRAFCRPLCKNIFWELAKLTDRSLGSLREEHKALRITLSHCWFTPPPNKAFLHWMITGNEWKMDPFFDNKVCKSQWLSSGKMPVPMPKAELHPGKVMPSIWWYISGVWFIWRYRKWSHNLLHPLLNPALQWKHPSLVNSRGTILHQVMPVPTVQTNPGGKKKEVINSAIKYVYFLHVNIYI